MFGIFCFSTSVQIACCEEEGETPGGNINRNWISTTLTNGYAMSPRAEGAREFYEGDSDDEDEAFCDIDNDPSVLRRVFELDGMEEGGPEEDDEDDENHGAGMALRPDGYSDGRNGSDDDEDEVREAHTWFEKLLEQTCPRLETHRPTLRL